MQSAAATTGDVPLLTQDGAASVVELPCRVVVVDADEIMRHGVLSLLRAHPRARVVGEAATSDEAVRVVSAARPDVLLIDPDLRSGARPGLALVSRLRAVLPALRVVMFTRLLDDEIGLDAVRAGVAGVVGKGATPAELLRVVDVVACGECAMDDASTAAVLRAVRSETVTASLVLTAREQEVLGLVAEGLSNKAIAARLFIAEATVKFHVRNIMDKLGVHRRVEVVATALRLGLVAS